MSAKQRGVAHIVRRALDSYQRARDGVPLSDVTRELAQMENLGAMAEVETYAIALDKPAACCSKCAARGDAQTQGMDVVFVPRKGV